MSLDWTEAAFPLALRSEVAIVASHLPPADFGPLGSFSVTVGGAGVMIPLRIYNPEPATATILSGEQRRILDCLYTRHNDGWTRHRHLQQIIGDLSPWVMPFVVQLVAEYVVEIIEDIDAHLSGLAIPGSAQQTAYGGFVVANPDFLRLTQARAISYWNCYYRSQFPTISTYPGQRVVTALAEAARLSKHAVA
jgi:hypothetical protein